MPSSRAGFFAHAGISDYRIVASSSATEGAPAASTAEVIVDITTSGATLAGTTGCKRMEDGTILKSQAQLAVRSPPHGMRPRKACKALSARPWLAMRREDCPDLFRRSFISVKPYFGEAAL